MPFLFSLAGILQPRAGSRFRAHALLLLRPLFPQHAPYRAACLARQTCLLVSQHPNQDSRRLISGARAHTQTRESVCGQSFSW